MDLKPEPMAGAVKETDLPSVTHLRGEPLIGEELLDLVVQRQAVDARLHFLQRHRLPVAHCLPQTPLGITRAPSHNSARHVAEIAALRVTRKDIEDNQRIRVERTGPAFVRITSLI